jgi:acyl-CoA synthetase (AMP-forming)/AMP-acid ligase II
MWLSSILRRHTVRMPDALALRDRWRDVSWRDFDRDVTALAGLLQEAVAPGGRVAVLSGNRVEVLETYFACARAGVIAVPVNPALTDREIAGILDSVEPSYAVAEKTGADRLGQLRPELRMTPIEELASLPVTTVPAPLGSGLTDPVAILHTSATTGAPKGVVVDQRAFQLNATSWLADVGVPAGTAFLNACPLFHGSMVIALDYLAAGATVCVLDRFTPQGALRAVTEWRTNHAFLVPSMVKLVLQAQSVAKTDVGVLDLVLHGAAPMPAELAAQAATELGVRLQTIFGITECGGPVISLRPGDEPGEAPVPGATCAGVPMAGTELRIRAEDGGGAGPGEIGEIQLTGDGLMQGYWRNPEATAEVLTDGPGAGWLNTRDLGLIDDQGLVWVVDRRNDLILRGGQNVYPAEIEHVLRQSAAVFDVAVVPAPSADWGQTPVAFVQPADGATVEEAELVELCVTRLASYKRPSRFVVVDRVPRNPAGKILRPQLRERARALVQGTVPSQGERS